MAMEVFELVGKIALDGTVTVVNELNRMGQKAEELQDRFEKAIGSRALDLSRKFAAGITALGAAAMATGIAGVKMAGDWEQNEIAFTTMLGSAERARQFLGELSDFAERTPFELPGLVDASKKLLAFGFEAENIIPMVTAVGDAVAGLGGGADTIDRITLALGQMQAKGKVSAQEMMQLAENGIPAWQYLADAIGVSIPEAMKMAEKGAITASQGINGVLAGMSRDFGGLMEQQATTINGLFSTAGDTISTILRELGFDIVETFDLKTKLAGAVAWLGDFAKALREGGIRKALEEMVPPGLQTTFVIIAGAIAGAVVPALGSMALAAWAAVAPLTPFIAAGAALAAVAYTIYKNWEPVSNFFITAWEKAVAATQIAWSAIKLCFLNGINEILGGLSTFAGWIPGFGEKIKAAKQAIEGMITEETVNIQKNTLKLLSDAHDDTAKKVKGAQDEQTEAVKNAVAKMAEQFTNAKEEAKRLGQEFNENATKIKLYETTIKELLNNGIDPQNVAMHMLIQEYEELTKAKQRVTGATKEESKVSKEAAEFEKEWTKKLLEQTGERAAVRELEKQEALKKAEELHAGRQEIDAYYRALDEEIDLEWKEKLLEQQAADEANEEAQYQAKKELLAMRRAEDLKAVGDNEAAKAKIRQYYANEEKKLEQDRYKEQARAIASGEKNVIDIVKDSKIKELDVKKEEVVASALAGIAKAWAESGGIPWIAIPKTLAIVAAKVPALAGIEAAKNIIGGLAEGGLAIAPIIAQIGEGRFKEAVLPLSDPVFTQLGEGIVRNLPQPQLALAGAGGGFGRMNLLIYLDKYQIASAIDEPLGENVHIRTGMR